MKPLSKTYNKQSDAVSRMPLKVDSSISGQIINQQQSPTYGKPTADAHQLLNEDVSEPIDVILETRYVQSPQPKSKLSAFEYYFFQFQCIYYTVI